MGRNFEKLIEYIVNSDEQNARKLFHQIVVSKSRSIYESLENEEMGEDMDNLMSEVEDDQTHAGMMEADFESEEDTDVDMDMDSDLPMDDEMDADVDMDMDSDLPMDDEMDADVDMDSDDMETRVDDLESAIEELQAEFEKLMSDSDEDEDEEMGDEAEADEDMDNMDDEAEEPEAEEADEDADEDEELDEHFIREYTEKAPKPVTSEEGGVNKKSTVAGKNDMGGTTANMVKGGDAKGRPAPSAKPMGVNDPKAAGKSAFKSQAPKPATKEVAGTNKDSVLESRKPRNKK